MECHSVHSTSRTPDRSVRANSANPSAASRDHSRSNNDQNYKTQVSATLSHLRGIRVSSFMFQIQKQLQLIKNVCDSMLEQNSSQPHSNVNVQQLRNNLTPSPLYSEPRRFSSPHPNALNIVNPIAEVPPWFPPNSGGSNNQNVDNSNYQSWLAANAIQTQSFMLNTLNQCCQMLWLQQRELVALRNAVNVVSIVLTSDSASIRPV